jgi:DNA-binding FadR family transcriptional regulator
VTKKEAQNEARARLEIGKAAVTIMLAYMDTDPDTWTEVDRQLHRAIVRHPACQDVVRRASDRVMRQVEVECDKWR